MTESTAPDTDLLLERELDVPPEAVWRAWTTPEQLKVWFTPAPYKTVGCEIDLRPGGAFHTVMESPEGERYPSTGCYLEVVDGRRLTFTSVLGPDFRPQVSGRSTGDGDEVHFTAVITIEPNPAGGTRYSALAMHPDADTARRHDEMGFQDGWGAALDQLVEMIKAA